MKKHFIHLAFMIALFIFHADASGDGNTFELTLSPRLVSAGRIALDILVDNGNVKTGSFNFTINETPSLRFISDETDTLIERCTESGIWNEKTLNAVGMDDSYKPYIKDISDNTEGLKQLKLTSKVTKMQLSSGHYILNAVSEPTKVATVNLKIAESSAPLTENPKFEYLVVPSTTKYITSDGNDLKKYENIIPAGAGSYISQEVPIIPAIEIVGEAVQIQETENLAFDFKMTCLNDVGSYAGCAILGDKEIPGSWKATQTKSTYTFTSDESISQDTVSHTADGKQKVMKLSMTLADDPEIPSLKGISPEVDATILDKDRKPTAPTTVDGIPEIIKVNDENTAVASGSVDADDDAITYGYQWTCGEKTGDGAVLKGQKKGEAWTLTVKAQTKPYGEEEETVESEALTRTITIANTAPVRTAESKAATVDEDGTLEVDPSECFTDADDADALTYSIATKPAHGTVSVEGGTLKYEPDKDYHGEDSLTFQASDGTDASAAVTLAITVNPINDAPAFGVDSYAWNFDEDSESPSMAISGFKPEDVDLPEGTSLKFFLSATAEGEKAVSIATDYGELAIRDGSIAMTPKEDRNGKFTVYVFAKDDQDAYSAPAALNIAIAAVNDAPVFVDNSNPTTSDVGQERQVILRKVAPGPATATDEQEQTLTAEVTAKDNVFTTLEVEIGSLDEAGKFLVDETGKGDMLEIGYVLDETAALGAQYEFTVKLTDSEDGTAENTYALITDPAPVFEVSADAPEDPLPEVTVDDEGTAQAGAFEIAATVHDVNEVEEISLPDEAKASGLAKADIAWEIRQGETRLENLDGWTIDWTFKDADGQEVDKVEADGAASIAAKVTIPGYDAIAGSPRPASQEFTLVLIAKDGKGAVGRHEFKFTVQDVDRMPTDPTAIELDRTEVRVKDEVTASASGSVDADGDEITYGYQWTCGEKAVDGAKLTGQVKDETWTLTAKAQTKPHGEESVESQGTCTTTLTVLNTAPAIRGDAVKTATVQEGEDLRIDLGAYFADADEADGLTYEITQNPAAEGSSAEIVTEDGSAVLVYHPRSDYYETDSLKIVAKDDDESQSEEVSLTIYYDQPPVIVAVREPADSYPEVSADGTSTAFTVSIKAHDEGNGEAAPSGVVDIAWTLTSDGGADLDGWLTEGAYSPTEGDADTGEVECKVVLRDGYGIIAGSPRAKATGDYLLTATVRDGKGATASHSWKFKIQDVDREPTAPNAIGGIPEVVRFGDEVTAGASGSVDADGDEITYGYQWTCGDRTVDGAKLTGQVKGETWALSVKALTSPYGDGTAASEAINTEITVANTAPARKDETMEKTVDEDGTLEVDLTGSFTDADAADTLAYRIVDQPAHGTASVEGGTLTYVPAKDYNGEDSLTFLAGDRDEDSEEVVTLKIAVDPVNDDPVFVNKSDIYLTEKPEPDGENPEESIELKAYIQVAPGPETAVDEQDQAWIGAAVAAEGQDPNRLYAARFDVDGGSLHIGTCDSGYRVFTEDPESKGAWLRITGLAFGAYDKETKDFSPAEDGKGGWLEIRYRFTREAELGDEFPFRLIIGDDGGEEENDAEASGDFKIMIGATPWYPIVDLRDGAAGEPAPRYYQVEICDGEEVLHTLDINNQAPEGKRDRILPEHYKNSGCQGLAAGGNYTYKVYDYDRMSGERKPLESREVAVPDYGLPQKGSIQLSQPEGTNDLRMVFNLPLSSHFRYKIWQGDKLVEESGPVYYSEAENGIIVPVKTIVRTLDRSGTCKVVARSANPECPDEESWTETASEDFEFTLEEDVAAPGWPVDEETGAPLADGFLPEADKVFYVNTEDTEVSFEWPSIGAEAYTLLIYDQYLNPVGSVPAASNTAKVLLGPGSYSWQVAFDGKPGSRSDMLRFSVLHAENQEQILPKAVQAVPGSPDRLQLDLNQAFDGGAPALLKDFEYYYYSVDKATGQLIQGYADAVADSTDEDTLVLQAQETGHRFSAGDYVWIMIISRTSNSTNDFIGEIR